MFPTEEIQKREELEQLVYDTVEQNGCCYGNYCPFARGGWHRLPVGHLWLLVLYRGHQHTTHKKDPKGGENLDPAFRNITDRSH